MTKIFWLGEREKDSRVLQLVNHGKLTKSVSVGGVGGGIHNIYKTCESVGSWPDRRKVSNHMYTCGVGLGALGYIIQKLNSNDFI